MNLYFQKDKHMQTKFVKIIVKNKNQVLLHKFQRVQKWGFPAGRIEENESPRQAAIRELLERTGFLGNPKNLKFLKIRSDFAIFEISLENLRKIGEPGEFGGYDTQMLWKNFPKFRRFNPENP